MIYHYIVIRRYKMAVSFLKSTPLSNKYVTAGHYIIQSNAYALIFTYCHYYAIVSAFLHNFTITISCYMAAAGGYYGTVLYNDML